MTFILLLAAAAPPPDETIAVTASLEPVRAEASPASATVIDERRIEALGAPLVSDLARLAPGVSVAVSGAQGSLTQIRIRDGLEPRLVAGSGVDGDAGVAASLTRLRSDGIDIFGGGAGDGDGFGNLAGRLKAAIRPGNDGEIGIVGQYIRATSRSDGTPAPLFRQADTLDSSRAEIGAARAWTRLGLAADAPWSVELELFGRVENAANSDYREVFGYDSQGRSVHAGLRVGFGD